jgi:hypothetical protein
VAASLEKAEAEAEAVEEDWTEAEKGGLRLRHQYRICRYWVTRHRSSRCCGGARVTMTTAWAKQAGTCYGDLTVCSYNGHPNPLEWAPDPPRMGT